VNTNENEITELDRVRSEVSLTARVVMAYAAVGEMSFGTVDGSDIADEVAKLKRLRARQAELEAHLAGKDTP
jgi:hypothetical protein